MTDRIFLDTNIMVYALDSECVTKQKRAKEILDQFYSDQNYRISTQVVQEFCSVVLKKILPSIPEKKLLEFISTLPLDQVAVIDINTITRSLTIKEEYKYSLWDSLIIAAAELSGCNVLYTEDMSNNQVIGNLKIVNPFL